MSQRKMSKTASIIIAFVLLLFVTSCGTARRPEDQSPKGQDKSPAQEQKPELPAPIKTQGNQEPRLKVYIIDEKRVEEMAFEEYVAGVVGGEIKNDWPEETIKAQAIIARTFVLQFIEEKGKSKYENAHVSTDIEEAQAWNMEAVNDRIRKAVNDTRGQVIVYQGQFANTWFHSNAGGKTATASEGLEFKEENPPYIRVIDSPDIFQEVPEDEREWTASFPKASVIAALRETGKPLQNFSKVSIGKTGPSGRAMTILFDQTEVSGPQLRLALGSTEMKSTLLDGVDIQGNQIVFRGRGYGHGVGMSQWGAYSLANGGKSAEDIIDHYFPDVNVVKMWD